MIPREQESPPNPSFLALQNNILFGQPYDEQRYDQVIKDACLGQDLAMLPFGDATEIGEKVGLSLSLFAPC